MVSGDIPRIALANNSIAPEIGDFLNLGGNEVGTLELAGNLFRSRGLQDGLKDGLGDVCDFVNAEMIGPGAPDRDRVTMGWQD